MRQEGTGVGAGVGIGVGSGVGAIVGAGTGAMGVGAVVGSYSGMGVVAAVGHGVGDAVVGTGVGAGVGAGVGGTTALHVQQAASGLYADCMVVPCAIFALPTRPDPTESAIHVWICVSDMPAGYVAVVPIPASVTVNDPEPHLGSVLPLHADVNGLVHSMPSIGTQVKHNPPWPG
jgi:hypothetical protein